ncbi:MAG: hypothetical protein Q6365_022245 [Candidatus Sigynarchaeota archaeon]
MTDYNIADFIRAGKSKLKTMVISEAIRPGEVLNVQDASLYDQDDTDLGVFINDIRVTTAMGSQATANQRGYYIPMTDAAGCEVRMTEGGHSSISGGAYVKVTTDGKIAAWSYVDGEPGSDTFRDVIGRASEAIAQGGTGWVKLGRV